MDLLVRVLSQGPLEEFDVKRQDGSKKTSKSVTVKMTDGYDTIVGQAYDDLADSLEKHKLDTNRMYKVQAKISVSEWTSSQTGALMQKNSIRINSIETI